jgi:hypothetical protein
MTDIIEAPTRDAVFSFDGRLLELFAMDGSQRFHPSLLPELWIDGEFLYCRRRDVKTVPWIFEESQRSQIERLVAAVVAARAPQ